jgi:hypothetical protein
MDIRFRGSFVILFLAMALVTGTASAQVDFSGIAAAGRLTEDRHDISSPDYLRTNGVPYSESAVLTEYLDRHTDLGVDYITHARIVDDPKYLTERYIITSHFKREPDGSKWDPKPCIIPRPFKDGKPTGF